MRISLLVPYQSAWGQNQLLQCPYLSQKGRFSGGLIPIISPSLHILNQFKVIYVFLLATHTHLDLWQYHIRFQLIDWHPAADKGHDNMAVWTDRICQADCGSYFGRRKIIERKRHQDDFTLYHGTVSHRKACRYPLLDLSGNRGRG